jgi:hypothetical protein
MDIQVDDGHAFDTVHLKLADGDCDIIERTEALAVIGKCMVQSTTQVAGHLEAGTLK